MKNTQKTLFTKFPPKTMEITLLAVFFFFTSIIYIFPSIFIIYIISANVIMYLIGNIIYHKYSFQLQQMKIKRIMTYINLYESLFENTCKYIAELYKTTQYIKNFRKIQLSLKEKRGYINHLKYRNFFLETTKYLQSTLISLINLETGLKRRLKSSTRKLRA